MLNPAAVRDCTHLSWQEMQEGEVLHFIGWFLAGGGSRALVSLLDQEPYLSLSDCSTQALTQKSGCVITWERTVDFPNKKRFSMEEQNQTLDQSLKLWT